MFMSGRGIAEFQQLTHLYSRHRDDGILLRSPSCTTSPPGLFSSLGSEWPGCDDAHHFFEKDGRRHPHQRSGMEIPYLAGDGSDGPSLFDSTASAITPRHWIVQKRQSSLEASFLVPEAREEVSGTGWPRRSQGALFFTAPKTRAPDPSVRT